MANSEEELKQARLEKYRQMGMPVPIDKQIIEQSISQIPVKNQNIYNKLQAIKQGANKSLNREIINHGVKNAQTFQPLGEGKSKNAQVHKNGRTMDAPPLEEHSAAPIPNYDDMFSTGSGPSQPQMPSGDRKSLSIDVDPNDTGRNFTNSIREKFQEKMAAKGYAQPEYVSENTQPGTQQSFIKTTSPQLHSGMILIDEAELSKKMTDIATSVAKSISEKMIKSVLNEYMKSDKDLIIESDKIKKAEMIGKDAVRIDGKVFKLVPAVIKQKTEPIIT